MANKKVVIGVSVAIGAVLVGLAIFLGIYLTRDKEENYAIDVMNVINTDVGSIRGLRSPGDDYLQFLGIPYAEVDKANPFGLSKPYPKFDNTFNADDGSKVCPQIHEIDKNIIGTIDCLNLNVYKPDSASSDNLVPVIVWLNGEGFMNGLSGQQVYGPDYLIRHDVIVVSINYRVGAYGFMCLDTPEVSGNQGLKDQLLALRWIKNNIQAFGGNPNKVTMLGHGSGARSVDLHLISDQEILFNQAILQSGVAIAPPSVADVDNSLPLKLAAKLGLNTNSVSEALSHVASAKTDDVVKAASEITSYILPCIEKGNFETFLSRNPINIKPRVSNMPILLGVTNNEKYSAFTDQSPEFNERLESLIHYKLSESFNFDNDTLYNMVDVVRRFYLGDDPIDDSNRQQIINFDSDFDYLHPNQRRLYDFMDNNAGALYNYVFSYEGQRNFGKYKNSIQSSTEAMHGDELGYLFDLPVFTGNPTAADKLMIDRLTTMWTNFVKHGSPTVEVTQLLPTKWEPVTSDVLYFLNIDDELTLDNRPYKRRLTFWDMFYKLHEENLVGLL